MTRKPRHHFFEAERLGDVVVRAEGEAADLVLHRVLRGEEQHRSVHTVGAQPLEQAESVHSRHHDVENHGVGPERAGRVESLGPGRRRRHLESLKSQTHGEQLEDVRFVVDDEDAGFDRLLIHATHHHS